MQRRKGSFLALTVISLAMGCSGSKAQDFGGVPDAQAQADAPPGLVIGTDAGPGLHTASAVDLLFMIDNSASMGDKQELLRQAVPDLLHRLTAPNCVDASGASLGVSVNGACTAGKPEFLPVADIHLGIVSSSLGGRGGDLCKAADLSPVTPTLSRHNDDSAHLINRAGADEHSVQAAAASGFLAWTPAVGTADALTQNFQDMLSGVNQYGCGLEAQLESWYRFLIQPDPYAQIITDPNDDRKRTLDGVDAVILKQRHDFLRPDSLVAIILMTDEDDSTIDPLALNGQSWSFANSKFPGSCGGACPRGTAACDNVASVATEACASCNVPGHEGDPGCAKVGDTCMDPSGTMTPQAGFYAYADDPLNVRMFHMKQRYGADPQFPIARYVDGLTSRTVPDRDHEHGPAGVYSGEKNCTNPLFAKNLPTAPGADLCHLEAGPRGGDLVYYGIIGGVPHQLLQEDPSRPDSPLKKSLTTADWTRIVGRNPAGYDYTGVDPHMWQAIKPNDGPRGSLPAPDRPDTADPASGREWDTKGGDLQYACTFALAVPLDCSSLASACDCGPGQAPPLCAPGPVTLGRKQLRGKAYPSIRELAVASQLNTQGIAASICPIHEAEATAGDPLFGYRPAMNAIVDRFRTSLVHAD